MKRLLWLFLALGLIALMGQSEPGCALEPVLAEFTSAEKQEIEDQLDAVQKVSNSLDWAAKYVDAQTTEAAINELEDFIDATTVARRTHLRGIWALIDGPYDDSPDGTSHTQARSTVISEGKTLITGSTYTTARAKLQTMIDNCPSSCPNLTTAASEFDAAITLRDNFDDTLDYTEPRLAVNLLMPGSSRSVSATAGPHGDYLFYIERLLNSQESNNSDVLERAADATVGEPTAAMMDELYDVVSHNKLIEYHIIWATGLLVDVEMSNANSSGLSIDEHVDVMEAGGVTARGREFFQILLAMEMMLNRVDTQTPDDVEDVNERTIIRGSTYDFTRVCQQQARMLRDVTHSPALPDWVSDLAWSIEENCNAWRDMDSGIFHGSLLLKFFQAGEIPDFCGTGTEWNGVQCVIP